MSGRTLLLIVGALQAAFFLLLLVFLLVRRSQNRRTASAVDLIRAGLSGPLRAWLVDGGEPEALLRELRLMPEEAAVGFLALLAKQTLPVADAQALRARLLQEGWVRTALARWNSRLWWRRLEAARAFALMGTPTDRERVLALLEDQQPVVQIAACAALPRVLDDVAIARILDRMERYPKVVRQGITLACQPIAHLVGPALAERIATGRKRHEVATWIEFAEAINNIAALEAALSRVEEDFVAIRRTTAKALRRLPGRESESALVRLLKDADASVRAAAARTLGLLGARGVVKPLTALLSDPVWIVRVRAAVSLAQAGEPGKDALRAAREGGDRYARDMAAMISDLSEGALLDLGDA
ncbi:MAG: putative lyase HEAT-like repeat domain [Gemmatimonadota bacterium]